MVQDHGAEIGGGRGAVRGLPGAAAAGGVQLVDQLLVHGGDDAVRRERLHRERPGDAHARLVLVGAVVEQFHVRALGDGSVDGGLAGDAGLPPGGVQAPRLGGPGGAGLAGDLPFLPGTPVPLGEFGVQRGAQRFQRGLRGLPQHVDLGVVGDGFQRDVRRAVVDEALPQVALNGAVGCGLAGELGFLGAALAAVGEQVIGVAGGHDPGAREGEGDAGGVDGDPAPAPLLGDSGGSARAAGRIEDEVTGVGGHEDAAFEYCRRCLNDISLSGRTCDIRPYVGKRICSKVVNVANVAKSATGQLYA